MQVTWIWCDLNPATLRNEQLLLLATLHSQGWAVNALMERLLDWIYAFVARLANRIQLQDADRKDAQQEGTVAAHQSIPSYDCLGNHEMTVCSLQAFLRTVLRRRFRNFMRGLGHSMLHGAVSLGRHRDNVLGTLGSVSLSLPGVYRDWRDDDPVSIAEKSEAVARVQVVVERLGEVERQICKAVATGVPLVRMLEILQLSYATIRRRRDEIFSEIRGALDESDAA